MSVHIGDSPLSFDRLGRRLASLDGAAGGIEPPSAGGERQDNRDNDGPERDFACTTSMYMYAALLAVLRTKNS